MFNKVNPHFVGVKILEKKKLNYASFVIKFGTKKNFFTHTINSCL